MKDKKEHIGFIGQGFIGKNYADDFEARGYKVTRYALEAPYNKNRDKIKECGIVFIAVPTPTTPKGFDYSIVESALKLLKARTIAVIKSTMLPGSTEALQKKFPKLIVMHSPEFLREQRAAYDAANPSRNIMGVPLSDNVHMEAARRVLDVLPRAMYERIMTSREAELVKYGGNCFLYTKVIFMNLMYELAQAYEADFEAVSEAMAADERIGQSHMHPVHASGHPGAHEGRGAGGHCFIKDFAAFENMYREVTDDELGLAVLAALQEKNNKLLRSTNKDLDLLKGVFGS